MLLIKQNLIAVFRAPTLFRFMAACIALTYPSPLYPLAAPQVPGEGVAFSRMASMLHCRLVGCRVYFVLHKIILISIYQYIIFSCVISTLLVKTRRHFFGF